MSVCRCVSYLGKEWVNPRIKRMKVVIPFDIVVVIIGTLVSYTSD